MDACQMQKRTGDSTPVVARSPTQQENLETQGFAQFQHVLDQCLPPPSTRDWYADSETKVESIVLTAFTLVRLDGSDLPDETMLRQRRLTKARVVRAELWATLYNALGIGVYLMAPDGLDERYLHMTVAERRAFVQSLVPRKAEFESATLQGARLLASPEGVSMLGSAHTRVWHWREE